MSKRIALFAALAAVVALAAAAFAFGGGSGPDQRRRALRQAGHARRRQGVPPADVDHDRTGRRGRRARRSGQLGQVDLESHGGRIVYVVDVGNREVGVDATDGSVVSIAPQS